MVRSRKDRKYPIINSNMLEAAAEKVLKSETSVREAAKSFSVSKSTLSRHVMKLKKLNKMQASSINPKSNTQQ